MPDEEVPMGRKKKLVNHSDIPDYVIERIARAFYPDILASFQSEEGQQMFAEWKAEQAEKKKENRISSATDQQRQLQESFPA